MNIRRCLRTAERIRMQFDEQIGIGIDPQRMLVDAEYADDVLTVCDAHPRTALSALAQHFRLAAAEAADPQAASDVRMPPDSTLFGADNTDFGSSSTRPAASSNSSFDQEREAARAARRAPGWMKPGRWLGHDT
jgi:hypothetical protein